MTFLKTLWTKWLRIARVIGNFQAQVLFTVFYFLIIFPVGLSIRLFSDPLNFKSRKSRGSNFDLWDHQEEDLEMARKPY